MEYKCDYCNYTTEYKSSILYHINRQFKCCENPTFTENKRLLSCEFCNKTFNSLRSLNRHLENYCKIQAYKNQFDETINNKNIEITILKNIIKISEKTKSEPIQRNPFMNTSFDHLTNKDFKQICDNNCYCIKELVYRIHINPKSPENQNIYISNFKQNSVKIYNTFGKWELANWDEIINYIFENYQILIQDWIDKNGNALQKVQFSRFIDQKEIPSVLKILKNEIKLLLYNNSDLIKT